MSKMKTLKIGGSVFTITDNEARELIAALQKEMSDAQSNITTLQEAADDARQDIDTVMGVTVQPDTSLSTSGTAADAKVTGDAISQLNTDLDTLEEKLDQSVEQINANLNALPDTFVTSCNGQTGAVTINVPVTSVGGKTGDVELSAGTGISVAGTTITNSGVRSVATGSGNGTIAVNTNGSSTDVAVKGLGSAAYTESSAYMPKFTFTYTASDGVLKITT